MNPDIEQLKNRVAALEKWQAARTAQQITFPLDIQSYNILNESFMSKIGNLDWTNVSGGLFRNILVKQNNKIYVINVFSQLIRFTVNTTTDNLTLGQDLTTGAQGSFSDGEQVLVQSTDTLPAPLAENVPYYVVNSSSGGTVIQLSLTFGGAAIDITTTGVGEQYIYFFT